METGVGRLHTHHVLVPGLGRLTPDNLILFCPLKLTEQIKRSLQKLPPCSDNYRGFDICGWCCPSSPDWPPRNGVCPSPPYDISSRLPSIRNNITEFSFSLFFGLKINIWSFSIVLVGYSPWTKSFQSILVEHGTFLSYKECYNLEREKK